MKKLKTGIPMGELGGYATMLVMVGIIIAIGSLIFMTMTETDSFYTLTTTNESVTFTNNTHSALTYPRGVSILAASNHTGGQSIGLGNFTLLANYSASGIDFTGYPTFTAGQSIYIQYTHNVANDAGDMLDSSNKSINVFGDWLEIIAIVIVAVVVLALIKYL
jgi:hypothetical protein